MSLLNELKSKDKKEFKKDFLQIIRIAFGVDRYYKRAHPLIDKYIPKFRLLIESFNNKYKNLRLKIKRDIENVLEYQRRRALCNKDHHSGLSTDQLLARKTSLILKRGGSKLEREFSLWHLFHT